jgi:acyl carrier protein
MAEKKDKVYKCLNPVGIQTPVDTFPLAPRLDSLDGKEIVFSITGEPDITIALEKKLKMDYPQVDWKIKKNYNIEPNRLSEEEMKTADGLIQAVCW